MCRVTFLLVLLFSSVLVPPVAGQQEQSGGMASVEFYFGYYVPEDFSDELMDQTFGIRGGTDFRDRWAWEGSLGRFETTVGAVDLEALLLDLSLLYQINPPDRVAFQVFGGIGYMGATAEIGGVSEKDSSFTVNAGFTLKAYATERFYIRPDVRGRWVEACDESCFEWEFTLAVGFRF